MKTTIDRRRNKMDLPEIVGPNLEEIQFIIRETGLGNLIKKAEGDEK
jgi:hypothetical protein